LTLIAFIRHGNTDWNIEKRAQGHANNPLNKRGIKQAEAVAERLSNENWDVFFSSDLLRATQTAEIIASKTKIPIKAFCKELRELDRGQIEGTIEKDRIEKWGKEWRKYDLKQETTQSVQKRGVRFVRKIVDQYPEKKVLVVGHGFMIAQTLRALFKNDTEEYEEPDNASITVIEKKMKDWKYLIYNSTTHLDIKD